MNQNTSVEPHPSARELRHVFGHLPTGVTVITAFDGAAPTGMAVNSVTSVSLDPPLVLLCPARTSTTWPGIRRAGRFCVNVLAQNHEDACRRFALPGADRFGDLSWHGRYGGPALDDAVAWLDCELDAEHDAGDHTIAVARIRSVAAVSGVGPMVFFQGRYGTFAPVAAG